MALRVVTRFKVGDCHETEGAGIAKLLAITSRKEYPLVWNDASFFFSTTADGKVYADGRYSIRDIIGDPVPEPEGFKVEVVAPESDAEYVARMGGPAWLPELCKILGWHGGTVHQALDEVRRLKHVADAAVRASNCPVCREHWGGAIGVTCERCTADVIVLAASKLAARKAGV